MSGVSHLIGPAITIGSVMRQRCMWCGALVLDVDLARIAVPLPKCETCDGVGGVWQHVPLTAGTPVSCTDCGGSGYGPADPYPTWEAGAFVEVDGVATFVVPPVESLEQPGEWATPLSCCARLDPEITR